MAVDELQQTTLPRPADPAGKSNDPNETGSNPEGRRRTLLFAAVVGCVILLGAVGFWLYSRTYESTDDAQVDGHLNGITARIDGDVKAVHVEENQSVQAGEMLVELDPRDYEVAFEQAHAQLLKAQAGERAENPNLPITRSTSETSVLTTKSEVANTEAALAAAERDELAAQSRLQEVEANNAKAQGDVTRYKALVEKDEVSRSDYDQVIATSKALAASVDSARASSEAAQKVADQRRAQLEEARSMMESARVNAPNQVAISRANLQFKQADVQAMKAQLDRAQLDLSYCKIIAPVAGVISKRTVEIGEHVSKGQRLVTLADLGDLWVTADFKESQLKQMHPGQSVTISVDAFDQDFDGTVEAMPGSTGSVTSLLPPENATGNYVKVVQRLPVRIRFKPGQPGLDRLRPGMSVVPKVWLK
ncbi:MAG TPA: HlyD family secretion protein [Candidatus Acidoferrales bacterium]|jgi:membrane fusion protein (multidrug efflux system)|nr:HlyD family secretion protein [Candidatus Acidoferrales bacterium]